MTDTLQARQNPYPLQQQAAGLNASLQHSDATAVSPDPASPVPADGRPQLSSAGATDAPRGFEQCSDRIDAISAALAKAQGQIANPGKTATNPHFKSQYADLSAGLKAVRTALSANAIAIVQTTRMEGDVLVLFTALTHASGQWIGSQWPVVKLPSPPQVIGSALTYARRYSLFALTGIAGENDDDDGNAASGKGKEDDESARSTPTSSPRSRSSSPKPRAISKSSSTRWA